jgi:hypothetical protein
MKRPCKRRLVTRVSVHTDPNDPTLLPQSSLVANLPHPETERAQREHLVSIYRCRIATERRGPDGHLVESESALFEETKVCIGKFRIGGCIAKLFYKLAEGIRGLLIWAKYMFL